MFSLVFVFSLFCLVLALFYQLFQLVSLYQAGWIRSKTTRTDKNGGYRNVNSNCGSWVSRLCRTVTPMCSVGTEVTGQGIRKERGMWYGEIQDKLMLSLSWWEWPEVQAATLTTAPTPLDSECREAEGSYSSCLSPQGSEEVYEVQARLTLHQPSEHKHICFTSASHLLYECFLWSA